MNILFRSDSSATIGIGHIMRDLVLASQYHDDNIIFATQDLKGNINHKITEQGYLVKLLTSSDIQEVVNLINQHKIDMIVIDNYDIDYHDEINLKQQTGVKIFVVDDTYQKHNCDILLNHNISANEDKYQDLVPSACELRCGGEYTLLRDEFIIEKNKKRVFLAMGGADHSCLNIKILEVLVQFSNIEANVVTTSANKNLTTLIEYAKNEPSVTLHIDSSQIAKLMSQSNFAIITPSVVLNEILFMDIPFIAIKTAGNQQNVFEYLQKKYYLTLDGFSDIGLKKHIQKIIFSGTELINFTNLTLQEKQLVLEWRNHDSIRKWMFSQECITLDNHLSYIDNLPSQQDKKYFIVKIDGKSIGVIYFINISNSNMTAKIGLYAKPDSRGIGSFLMQSIVNYGFNELKLNTLISEVFVSNVAAIKLYKNFGFKQISVKTEVIIMECSNKK